MKGRRLRRGRTALEMGLSPLIDMVFILLVFFVATTIFVEEKGLETRTPEPDSRQAIDDSESLVFEISESGSVYFEGDEIGYERIKSVIASRASRSVAVLLEFPPATKTKYVVTAMNEAKGTKAGTVTLVPVPGG